MKTRYLLSALSVACMIAAQAQTWTQKASYGGTASYSAFSFTVNGKGYVGTGNSSATSSALTQAFWEYDPAGNTWMQKSNFPGSARYEAVGFALGNLGYAGTGYQSLSIQSLSDFYKYDPVSNSWSAVSSIPVARNCAVAFTIGQKAYVGTGDLTTNNNGSPSTDFYEYDAASDSWSAVASLPAAARTRAIAFAIGGKGYVGGGTFDGTTNLGDFWEYDPQANNWTQRANMPVSTRVSTGFAIGYRGFFATGGNPASSTQLYEYDPIQNNWTSRPNFGGLARWGASAFVIGIKGYVGGGRDGSVNYSDWWEYSDETLAVTETGVNVSVEIFPNPVVSACTINITAGNEAGQFTFELFDINGKCVRRATVSRSCQFSREGLSSGVYLYRISTKKGELASGEMLVQ